MGILVYILLGSIYVNLDKNKGYIFKGFTGFMKLINLQLVRSLLEIHIYFNRLLLFILSDFERKN